MPEPDLARPVMPGLLRSPTRAQIDLAGRWTFALDPEDHGVQEGWFSQEQDGTIDVPHSWEEQGYGWRPPEQIGGWTKRRNYEGAAWYARTVEVPSEWAGRRVWLQLDRANWQTEVWVDGQPAGAGDSLSVPHRFDLTATIRPGERNLIVVRVNNRVRGVLNYEGHIHSRHTATNWGGITGDVRLIATPPVWIEGLEVYPDAARRRVRCVVTICSEGDVDGILHACVAAEDRTIVGESAEVSPRRGTTSVELDMDLGSDARLWSDLDPFLHKLRVDLSAGEATDTVTNRFGLRTIERRGRQLFLNGNPLYLRGYVDCCIFPYTGYPPADKTVYADQFARAKEYGFNHVRLHSWTPPAAFFEAADEAGMLVQNELPSWGNCNDPDYLAGAGDFLRREMDRVVVQLQPHPSLVIHCTGNEQLQTAPGGSFHRFSPFLNELIRRSRELDPSRLYLDQSGFGHLPEEPERVTDLNCLGSFLGTTSDSTTTWSRRVAGGRYPVIAHEHTQMDMYIRLADAARYTGIMEASWKHQAREGLEAKGMLDEADRFYAASAQLQRRCIKELFERIRRTPELSGLQMLNLTDFPGQGTAANGVLDTFWEPKGHVTAEEFRRYNGATVLLCSCSSRTFPTGGWWEADLSVSHFGQKSLRSEVAWRLRANEGILAEGRLPAHDVEPGNLVGLGRVNVRLPEGHPQKLVLSAELVGEATTAENEWDFWVFPVDRWPEMSSSVRARPSLGWLGDYYPSIAQMTLEQRHDGVIVTDALNVRYVEELYNGATLVYLAENEELADGVRSGFESLFWTYLWFPSQPNPTMGMVIEDHPLTADFPNDGHSDWQWYHLVEGANALSMDGMPRDLRPIVGGIDNWNRAKRLGYMLEARVGRGRFLMTTLKLLDDYPRRPEAVYLLDRVLRYVHGDAFAPQTELSLAHLWAIPQTPRMWREV